MSIIADLKYGDWERAAQYGHDKIRFQVNNDFVWNQVLQTKYYDWQTMDSAMWGNLAILIYHGSSIEHRKQQAEELKNIVISSLS